MADLERCLEEAAGARHRMIATDGVFSMDGIIANLPGICDLAEKYDAMVMVDDCHAIGFVGETGRGTPEHCGVAGRVDIITGTLGKALGGASGGFTAARREVVELLRQRSRPYLFSNTLAPAIAATSLRVLEMIEQGDELRRQLADNAARFREGMTKLGFTLAGADHPIVPVMLGDAALAQRVRRAHARPRRLRRRLLVPGGAARPGAHPHPDVGGAHAGRTSTRRSPRSPRPAASSA